MLLFKTAYLPKKSATGNIEHENRLHLQWGFSVRRVRNALQDSLTMT